MPKYAEIQAKIAQLQKEAAIQRNQEVSAVIDQIKSLMREYDITERDLKFTAKGKAGKSSATAKYRDNSGNEWGGRGRMPHWLQGKNKDDFLVK